MASMICTKKLQNKVYYFCQSMTFETIQMFICFNFSEQFFWFNDTCNKMPILITPLKLNEFVQFSSIHFGSITFLLMTLCHKVTPTTHIHHHPFISFTPVNEIPASLPSSDIHTTILLQWHPFICTKPRYGTSYCRHLG